MDHFGGSKEKSFGDQYIQDCLRTESNPLDDANVSCRMMHVLRLMHAAMGMTTESGEIMDQLKKHVFYGKPLDETNLAEEIGDLFWYSAIMCNELGITFEEVMKKNIAKLRCRFPDKFSSEKAITRNLEAERSILESEVLIA